MLSFHFATYWCQLSDNVSFYADDEADYYFDKEYNDDNNETSNEDEEDVYDSSTVFPTDSTPIRDKPLRPHKQGNN